MAILDLLIAATMPVLKVLLVTGVGSILAARPLNILNDEARKHLNNVGPKSFLSSYIPTSVSCGFFVFIFLFYG